MMIDYNCKSRLNKLIIVFYESSIVFYESSTVNGFKYFKKSTSVLRMYSKKLIDMIDNGKEKTSNEVYEAIF